MSEELADRAIEEQLVGPVREILPDLAPLARSHHLSDRVQQPSGIDRFAERRVNARDPRLAEFILSRPRNCNYMRRRRHDSKGRDQLEAIDVRHLQIGDHHIDHHSTIDLQCLRSVARHDSLVTGPPEESLQEKALKFQVVNDQDACHSG